VPTLVLQSTDDIIAPQVVGEFVRDQIPGSSFVQLATTGHIANLSGPEEVVHEITAFLT
jgi:sigma-B regulation protein RsbQ